MAMRALLNDLGPHYALKPDVLLEGIEARRDRVLIVQDGKIARIADAVEVEGVDIVRLPHRAIIPGFVDAHTHLGQTFGKAFVFGEPSQIWQRIWGPVEGTLTPELMRAAATWMCLESLRGGFTTICNFALADDEKTAAIHDAAAKTGVRLVSSTGSGDLADYPVLTDIKPHLVSIDAAIKRAERHLSACKNLPRLNPSICCSGIQGATPDLIATMASFCADHGIIFQFHSNEHFPEVHGCVVRHGMRPIELLADRGVLGRHVLLHHCTLVSDREISLLAETETAVSYNPVASLWKGDGVAPALSFVEKGVRFGLGTDSTRSNALRLLDAAEGCQRIAYGMPKLDFSCGAGWRWVDAATRGGADACGLGTVTGTLGPGKAADFIVLDMDRPEVQPSWDFTWELVRLYDRDQIEAVFVDGNLVMSGGRAVGWDQDTLLHEQLPLAIEAVKRSGALRAHGPSSDHLP